jgi:hypothetical protein
MTNRRDWTEQEKLRLKVSQRTIEGKSWGWDELTPDEQAQLKAESKSHLQKQGFIPEPSDDNLLTKAFKFLVGG